MKNLNGRVRSNSDSGVKTRSARKTDHLTPRELNKLTEIMIGFSVGEGNPRARTHAKKIHTQG